MSARRDRRPPSGRVATGSGRPETSSRPMSAAPTAPTSSTPAAAVPRPTSAMPAIRRPVSAAPASARSDASELSMNEVLRRIREKADVALQAEEDRNLELLGPYNAFSRPKTSTIAPLRTVLLDPGINNFPRSRTRSELMKRIRATSIPHPSYDLDNDGYVSMQDYRLAKRFDLDGNGVLDAGERDVGKRILADEFFRRHPEDLHLFGARIASQTHSQNVEHLVNAYSFERAYGKLMSVERTLIAESSKPMIQCMEDVKDQQFQMYYRDKMDTSAWNDKDRLPAAVLRQSLPMLGTTTSTSLFSTLTSAPIHQGSRKRLLFARKQAIQADLAQHPTGGGAAARSFGRVKLISDIRVENS